MAIIEGRRIEDEALKIYRGVYSILLGGRSLEVRVEALADGLLLHTGGREHRVDIVDPRSWRRSRGGENDLTGRQQGSAPKGGKNFSDLVPPRQQVGTGEGLPVGCAQ